MNTSGSNSLFEGTKGLSDSVMATYDIKCTESQSDSV